MANALFDHFDAVYVIGLDHRRDRRASLERQLQDLGLADPDRVQWVRAIPGEKCGAPGFFQAGPGAWGCLQSHLQVLQSVIMDDVGAALVLEDDAVFHPDSRRMLKAFFKELAQDWGQIFLGGEHAEEPLKLKACRKVVRARRIHRTHAYGIKGYVAPEIYQYMSNYPGYMKESQWHLDHQFGEAHHKRLWNTYASAEWIVGQRAGDSDISNKHNPDHWWTQANEIA